MRKLLFVGFLTLAGTANASTVIDNSKIVNVSVTTSAVSQTMIDLAQADSASWQMAFNCAQGSMTIQEGNDGATWQDINVAGSSITVKNVTNSTTNQLFSIANPAYRYVNFKVTNSSAPVSLITAPPCTMTATQCLRSLTIQSN